MPEAAIPARANLAELVSDIGPMPAFLACGFIARIAHILTDSHDHGVIHGDIRPSRMTVGPMVGTSKTLADGRPLCRPAPDAVADIQGLGKIPVMPAIPEWPGLANLPSEAVAFLPPERLDSGMPSFAGDVFSLAASLYFLLTARAPTPGVTAALAAESLNNFKPIPLRKLRRDLSPELTQLVDTALSLDPTVRPMMPLLAEALAPFSKPPESDDVALLSSPAEGSDVARLEPAPVVVVPAAAWDAIPQPDMIVTPVDNTYVPTPFDSTAFIPSAITSSATLPTPRRQPTPGMTRSQLRTWLWAGALVWTIGIIGWFILFSQGCDGNGDDRPKKKQKK